MRFNPQDVKDIIALVRKTPSDEECFNEIVNILRGYFNDAAKLQCLENVGVDNWDFYDDAMEEYYNGETE